MIAMQNVAFVFGECFMLGRYGVPFTDTHSLAQKTRRRYTLPHDGVQSYHYAKPETVLAPISRLVGASTWYPRLKVFRGVQQLGMSNDAIPQLYTGQNLRNLGIEGTKAYYFG